MKPQRKAAVSSRDQQLLPHLSRISCLYAEAAVVREEKSGL